MQLYDFQDSNLICVTLLFRMIPVFSNVIQCHVGSFRNSYTNVSWQPNLELSEGLPFWRLETDQSWRFSSVRICDVLLWLLNDVEPCYWFYISFGKVSNHFIQLFYIDFPIVSWKLYIEIDTHRFIENIYMQLRVKSSVRH